VTILDTSGAVDFLLGLEAAEEVQALMSDEGELAAPDLLVFEVVAVLRRQVLKGSLPARRATAAVEDLGDLAIQLFPSMPLRGRAWSLHRNLTVADALFVSLAEQLDEPLATKDGALAEEISKHTRVPILRLGG
jgi:predicted nucleic acid-binding protein